MNTSNYIFSYNEDNTELISVEFIEESGSDGKELFIEDGTKIIKEDAITSLDNMEVIHLPGSLETIEFDAVSNCKSLRSIIIPKNVKSIGGHFLYECNDLEEIVVDEENQHFTVHNGVLVSADYKQIVRLPTLKNIETLIIPNSVEEIFDGAFCFNKHLKEITFPEKNKVIDSLVCAGCTNLQKVELPNDLIEIDEYAFWSCESLSEIYFPEGLEKIGRGAFSGCAFSEINLPSTLKEIGENAFWGCVKISSIHINRELEKIDDGAFYAIPLENVTIDKENQVFTTDGNALFANDGMKLLVFFPANPKDHYTIPVGTEVVANYAFSYCNNLKSLSLSRTLREVGYSTFSECNNLESFAVPASNPSFKAINDILFSKNFRKLYYPNGRKTPNGVLYIPDSVRMALYESPKDNQFKEISFPKSYVSLFSPNPAEVDYKVSYRAIKCSYDINSISDDELREKAEKDKLELTVVLSPNVGIEPLHSRVTEDVAVIWTESFMTICFVDVALLRDFVKDMIMRGDVLGLRYEYVPECEMLWYLGRSDNEIIRPSGEKLLRVLFE